MATRTLICHIAACDVTGCKTEPDPPYHWDSPQQAIDYTAEDDDWTLTADGRLVCGVSDTAHYLVRGHESPALLAPGPDAMGVIFSKEAA